MAARAPAVPWEGIARPGPGESNIRSPPCARNFLGCGKVARPVRICLKVPLKMLVSVIVPCYNEEQVIVEANHELVATFAASQGIDFEIIYVDDGSRDAPAKVSTRL
jgi:cellulose synthase/poly-beta-1,6-N-acetylglucosamine synthase-like glycosyltransferase